MQQQGNATLEGILGVARDAMAEGQVVKATVAVIEVSNRRDAATPVQLVDLLERSCVYGPRMLVDFVWDELGPFAYTGWALALALRCAREDVARDLLQYGVTLLADVPQGSKYQAIAAHEVSLSRFDLTEGSPNLLLNMGDRTVCSEVFAPFSGSEQLVGGSFATMTSIAATCDVIGRLCAEGMFSDIVFADLFRAAVVRAGELATSPDPAQPEARGALMELAERMLVLRRERGSGGQFIELVVANLLRDTADISLIRFLCEQDASIFYDALESFPWVSAHIELVRSLVPYLKAGTQDQNAQLATVLARAGCLDELKQVLSWPHALDVRGIDAAIQAASTAGHAETSAWLLGERSRVASCENGNGRASGDDLSALFL